MMPLATQLMTVAPQHSVLTAGESPMPFAPGVMLANGNTCIPQHYLRYRHNEDSLRAIVSDIHFDNSTLIFAAADHAGLYVQVGMIGRENYDRSNTRRARKLVYGRKWRIEADTPTSEIIQTVMLAIQKAREHEVRELLTVTDALSGKTSAPLSNHHDLPLMANNPDLVQSASDLALCDWADAEQALQGIQFGQRPVQITQYEQRQNGAVIIDLQLKPAVLARWLENDLAEFNELSFSVMLEKPVAGELFYEIMAAFIKHSNRHIEENFLYKGFARFSRCIDPRHIAQLSIATRPYARDARNQSFTPVFKQHNYSTDAGRVPALGKGKLADRNRAIMARFGRLGGHLPSGYA